MPNNGSEKGSPIKDFVSQSLAEIAEGLPEGYSVIGNVDFDLTVTTVSGKSGKADIRVLSGGGHSSKQHVQRIHFQVGNPEANLQSLRSAFTEIFGGLAELEQRFPNAQLLEDNSED